MSRYVAFLRGINVGGHRVTSEGLRSCIEELGFRDVSTFRASGNLIFDGGRESAEKVAGRIEQGLAASLGYEVPAFVRTAAELEGIAKHEPFPAKLVKASGGKLQVVLLSAKPKAQTKQKALALATDEDRLAIRERELYWLPSGGLMDAALDLKEIERLLGSNTMRTKSTVDQIAAKYFSG